VGAKRFTPFQDLLAKRATYRPKEGMLTLGPKYRGLTGRLRFFAFNLKQPQYFPFFCGSLTALFLLGNVPWDETDMKFSMYRHHGYWMEERKRESGSYH